MALGETGGRIDVAKDFRHPLQAELAILKQSYRESSSPAIELISRSSQNFCSERMGPEHFWGESRSSNNGSNLLHVRRVS
jgi:hypothetical protein